MTDNVLKKLDFDVIEQEILTENIARGVRDDFQSFGVENCNEEKIVLDNKLNSHIEQMAISADNRAFRAITSHRPFLGPVIVLAKRIVRKLLKWYVEPICNQQSDFNHNAVACIKDFQKFKDKIELFLKENTVLENEQKKEVQNLRQQLEDCRKDVLLLKNEQNEKMQELRLKNEDYERSISLNEKLVDVISEFNQLIEKNISNDLDKIAEQVFERMKQDKYDLYSIIEKKPKYEFGQILSASQSGEDVIVGYILDSLGIPFSDCCYLDIGANHPKFMNNTYFFHCFGAKGVLVEANPELARKLKLERANDIVLNMCIAVESGQKQEFYILSGDGLSTIDFSRVEKITKENEKLEIDKILNVKTISIEDIFKEYFDETPMLVSLDIEGYELEILKSIDFSNNRPLIFIIETIPYINGLAVNKKNEELINYMKQVGYIEYAFTGINSIFLDTKNAYLKKISF